MKHIFQKSFGFIVIGLLFVGGIFAQNYKLKQTVSMNGQKSESIVYVKGSRKRTEGGGFKGPGGDVATVEQCDLKRNLKISDKKKMYAVEPFDNDLNTPTKPSPMSKGKTAPIVKGGVITFTSNITDTGERKQMFGLTARHVKTSMKMEATPDACMKENIESNTDGWYIDLPEFSCPITARPQAMPMPVQRDEGGCKDRIQFKTSGTGKLGFALQETRTFGTGEMNITQTTETLEFSKATLDAALFDIPNGYSLTANSQDLYGKPDMSEMMRGMSGNNDEDKPRVSPTQITLKPKKPGVTRIGVYAPTNNSGENLSTSNLQTFLIEKLTLGNIEAVPIGTEADARTSNCDYTLTSDFSKLKQSAASKIGGMFGKITNTDTSAAKNYEAQVDFKLISLSDGKTTLQNKAANKLQGDADKAAESVLSLEIQQIFGKIKK
jgi:hypothetical protein